MTALIVLSAVVGYFIVAVLFTRWSYCRNRRPGMERIIDAEDVVIGVLWPVMAVFFPVVAFVTRPTREERRLAAETARKKEAASTARAARDLGLPFLVEHDHDHCTYHAQCCYCEGYDNCVAPVMSTTLSPLFDALEGRPDLQETIISKWEQTPPFPNWWRGGPGDVA